MNDCLILYYVITQYIELFLDCHCVHILIKRTKAKPGAPWNTLETWEYQWFYELMLGKHSTRRNYSLHRG